MVGVPGKFKGCNTCRVRRVKCDNERPFCRRCVDGGRQCGGYERETVFIIGTIEDQGRCSSHPPRVLKPKKCKGPSKGDEEDRFELVPNEPLRPAWDDLTSVSCRGKSYKLQIAALHTDLRALTKAAVEDSGGDAGDKSVFVSLPPYETPDVRSIRSEDVFQLNAQCFVHLAAPDENQSVDMRTATDSICLFLYEHNSSVYFNNQPRWKDPSVQINMVRRMGPENFRSFPNHHFFVRIYRHHVISAALLSRTPTFLAGPEWTTTPWELHPKSPFDRLLDIVVLLPAIFARADRILSQEPTMARRLMAQDLLNNCLDIESQLSAWYASLNPPPQQQPPSSSSVSAAQPTFWPAHPPPPTTTTAERYTIPSQLSIPTPVDASIPLNSNPPPLHSTTTTTIALIYYQTALILFYPALWRLYWSVFDPPPVVVDHPIITAPNPTTSTTTTWPPRPHPSPPAAVFLPPARLHAVDPARYSSQVVRQLAIGVCRAVEAVLDDRGGCAQPDLLGVPLSVVGRVFGEVGLDTMGVDVDVDVGMDSMDVQVQMPMPVRPQGHQLVDGFGLGLEMDMDMDVAMGTGMGMGIEHGLMGGDGRLEMMMWCEALRETVLARGREIQEVVKGRRWVDLASF
ncbi:hypothetical protein VTK56DRAFT_7718 [Thermocarpiscus australiensis]